MQESGGKPVDPLSVAREHIATTQEESRQRRFSRQACPYCGSLMLKRRQLPYYLRPLRLLPGLYPRIYRCDACQRPVTLWRSR
jgi:hypothetical protein